MALTASSTFFLFVLFLVINLKATAATAAAMPFGPDIHVFADHMVLASSDMWSGGSTPARVWGNADANEAITITGLPAGAIVTPNNPFTADAAGNFTVTIAAASSLTPVNLVFTGSSSKHVSTINDVLFGHTILCRLVTFYSEARYSSNTHSYYSCARYLSNTHSYYSYLYV